MNQDPRTSEPTSFPDEPHQRRPGLETEMRTKPDHGEESYVGKALLSGMAALITGGDSGIGRRWRSRMRGRARIWRFLT